MSDEAFLRFVEEGAVPFEDVSRWYCDRPGCDGQPHGPHWHWCDHPPGADHPPGPEYASCRHARAKQVPPEGDWFIWFVLSGRGTGKSRSAAEWLVHSATHQDPGEWAVIARNAADVRKNCRDMTAGIVAVADRDRVLKQYNRHEEDIYLRNGAVIHAISADKPDRLRGFNLSGAWADELCLPPNAQIETAAGAVPIERVCAGSEVWTRSGLRRVLRARPTRRNAEMWELATEDGHVLRCTPDHRVWADGMWQEARGVTPGSRLYAWTHPLSSPSAPRLGSSGMGSDGTGWEGPAPRVPRATTETPEGISCTGWSGNEPTAVSRTGSSFTTWTGTKPTTASRTWHSSATPSTRSSTTERPISRPGTLARQPSGPTGRPVGSSAIFAARSSSPLACGRGSVTRDAQPGSVVVGSRPLPYREPVTYDLTVEGDHEFFADGILVHNCAWRFPSDTWDYGLMPALRAGKHPRVVVTTTPKPIALIKRLVEEARAEESKPLAKRSRVITTGSTFENTDNLAPNFIEEMLTLRGTRIGRQELEAELLFDTSGSLVTPEMIESGRIYPDRDGFSLEEFMGTLQRVVVAVDPAGSYGEESDETGIVVCAKGRDGHGYVLEDRSCKKSPHEWAAIAAAMYEKWQADAIAAEKNMGHDMVEDVIRSVAPYVRYIPIQAVMGKRLRAEPITALYEQNRIHHLGTFPKLEDQLTSWSPDAKYSPDRMDALVHGFTELGLAKWGLGHVWLDYYKQAVEDDLADPRPMRQAGFYPKYSEAPGAPEPTKCEHRWFPNVDGTYNCAKCGWRKA